MQLKYASFLNTINQGVNLFGEGYDLQPKLKPASRVSDEDAEGTAMAVTCVLDMAIEKAQLLAEHRDKEAKNDVNRAGVRCSQGVLCQGWSQNKSTFPLVLCRVCKKTRCTNCWGMTFLTTKPESFCCSECQAGDRDDWFEWSMEQMGGLPQYE